MNFKEMPNFKQFPTYVWKDRGCSDIEYHDFAASLKEQLEQYNDELINYQIRLIPIQGGIKLGVDLMDVDIGDSYYNLETVWDEDFVDYYIQQQSDPDQFMADFNQTIKASAEEASRITDEILPKVAKEWGFRKVKNRSTFTEQFDDEDNVIYVKREGENKWRLWGMTWRKADDPYFKDFLNKASSCNKIKYVDMKIVPNGTSPEDLKEEKEISVDESNYAVIEIRDGKAVPYYYAHIDDMDNHVEKLWNYVCDKEAEELIADGLLGYFSLLRDPDVDLFFLGEHFTVKGKDSEARKIFDDFYASNFQHLDEPEGDTDDKKMFEAEEVNSDHTSKVDDIEFVLMNYVKDSLGIESVKKIDSVTYDVSCNGKAVRLEFDPDWSEYVYTINGSDPYSHRSYEFIADDIWKYINTHRDGIKESTQIQEAADDNSYETKYQFLANHKKHSDGHQSYSRGCKVYDLDLTDEQYNVFAEFVFSPEMDAFWEVNEDLAHDIWQEGRSGGHLVLDHKVADPRDFDFNSYKTYDQYIDGMDQDEIEEAQELIDEHYEAVKDFDRRVDELIYLFKETLTDYAREDKYDDENHRGTGDGSTNESLNIRKELNKLDLSSHNKYDLLNLYESVNPSVDNKKKIAEMLKNNSSTESIQQFLFSLVEGYDDLDDAPWIKHAAEISYYNSYNPSDWYDEPEEQVEKVRYTYKARDIETGEVRQDTYVADVDATEEQVRSEIEDWELCKGEELIEIDDGEVFYECLTESAQFNLGSNKVLNSFNPDHKQPLKNLEYVRSQLEATSANNHTYKIKETYEDYGADMKWTTIYDSTSGCQVLSPREWLQIANAESTEELDSVITDMKADKYFQDKPKKDNSALKETVATPAGYVSLQYTIQDKGDRRSIIKADNFKSAVNILKKKKPQAQNIKKIDTVDATTEFLKESKKVSPKKKKNLTYKK